MDDLEPRVLFFKWVELVQSRVPCPGFILPCLLGVLSKIQIAGFPPQMKLASDEKAYNLESIFLESFTSNLNTACMVPASGLP